MATFVWHAIGIPTGTKPLGTVFNALVGEFMIMIKKSAFASIKILSIMIYSAYCACIPIISTSRPKDVKYAHKIQYTILSLFNVLNAHLINRSSTTTPALNAHPLHFGMQALINVCSVPVAASLMA